MFKVRHITTGTHSTSCPQTSGTRALCTTYTATRLEVWELLSSLGLAYDPYGRARQVQQADQFETTPDSCVGRHAWSVKFESGHAMSDTVWVTRL